MEDHSRQDYLLTFVLNRPFYLKETINVLLCQRDVAVKSIGL